MHSRPAAFRLSRSAANRYVLAKHQLLAPARSVAEVCDRFVGLRGAEYSTPYLACFWRVSGFRAQAFDDAVIERREIVRLNGVRGTNFWYSLPQAALVRAARAAQPTLARSAPAPSAAAKRLAGRALDALADADLSMIELRRRLDARGDADLGIAVKALLADGAIASLPSQGLDRLRPTTYFGDVRDIQLPTRYVRIDRWWPALTRAQHDAVDARRALVAAYVRGYGPVDVGDIAWWTGWGKREIADHLAHCGLAVATIEVERARAPMVVAADELPSLRAGDDAPVDVAWWLPGGDPTAKGYDTYSRFLASSSHKEEPVRFSPDLIAGGDIVGSWRYDEDDARILFTGNLFAGRAGAWRDAAVAAAERFTAFLAPGKACDVRFGAMER